MVLQLNPAEQKKVTIINELGKAHLAASVAIARRPATALAKPARSDLARGAATQSNLAVGSSVQRSTHHLLTAPPHPTRKVPRDRQASCSPEISHSHGPLPRGHGLRAGLVGHDADGSHHLGSVGSLGRRGVVAAAVLGRRRRRQRRRRLPAREARGVDGGSQVEEGDADADPERYHLGRQGAQPRQGPAPAEQEEEGASWPLAPHCRIISTLPAPVSLCSLCFSCSPSRTRSWRGASTSSPRRVTRFVLLVLPLDRIVLCLLGSAAFSCSSAIPFVEKFPEAACKQRIPQACRVQFCGSFGGSISSHGKLAARHSSTAFCSARFICGDET